MVHQPALVIFVQMLVVVSDQDLIQERKASSVMVFLGKLGMLGMLGMSVMLGKVMEQYWS